LIPLEISDVYPASHYVMADQRFNPNDFSEFAKTWKIFFTKNKFKKIHMQNSDFLKHYTRLIPNKTRIRIIKSKKKRD
jgi:7-cyano-7-deazaguanine tRNA-ribosyltransferase